MNREFKFKEVKELPEGLYREIFFAPLLVAFLKSDIAIADITEYNHYEGKARISYFNVRIKWTIRKLNLNNKVGVFNRRKIGKNSKIRTYLVNLSLHTPISNKIKRKSYRTKKDQVI